MTTPERVQAPPEQYPRGTVRGLWDSISKYAKTNDERELLDLAFRTAFQMHPDYWHEFDVLLVPAPASPRTAP